MIVHITENQVGSMQMVGGLAAHVGMEYPCFRFPTLSHIVSTMSFVLGTNCISRKPHHKIQRRFQSLSLMFRKK